MEHIKPIYLILLASVLFLRAGCNPTLSVLDFVVVNQTSGSLEIHVQGSNTHNDFISEDTKLKVWSNNSEGRSGENLIQGQQEIPFDSLIIWNGENELYLKDFTNIELWEGTLVSKNFGIFELIVVDDDF